MRTTLSLALILLSSARTASAAEDDAAFRACMQRAGGVNAAMHECIPQDLQVPDKRLNAVYTALRTALAPGRAGALRLDPQGGTLANVAAGDCKRRVARERAAELEALLALDARDKESATAAARAFRQ